MAETADIAQIEADLAAVMQTPDIAAELLAFEDAAMMANTDGGLTVAEAAETLVAFITSDEFVAYLETLPADKRNEFIDYYILNLAKLDSNLAKATLLELVEGQFTDLVMPGVEGDFTGYDVETLEEAWDGIFDLFIGSTRMATGATLAYMDELSLLSAGEKEAAGELMALYIANGGNLKHPYAFAKFMTEMGVDATLSEPLLNFVIGINDTGLVASIWAGLAGWSAYKGLSDGDLSDPVTVLRIGGDLLQTIAGVSGGLTLLSKLGYGTARAVGAAFNWIKDLTTAEQDLLPADAALVDWSDAVAVNEFLTKYKSQIYTAFKNPEDSAYADAMPAQVDEVIQGATTDLVSAASSAAENGTAGVREVISNDNFFGTNLVIGATMILARQMIRQRKKLRGQYP
jgi:hypothetical protein